jgi:hypothetical protein
MSRGAEPCWVTGPGVTEPFAFSFDVESSDGDYAFVTLWSKRRLLWARPAWTSIGL